MTTRRPDELQLTLDGVSERLGRLEHQAELIKTVLIVKEPNTMHAANAFDGLRKQVVAAAAERRSHLAQLATMAVALRRARSLDDLVPQLREWMEQAGVVEVSDVPPGSLVQDIYEDLDGAGLAGAEAIDVIEPAYVDNSTGVVLRLGRARRVAPAMSDRSVAAAEPHGGRLQDRDQAETGRVERTDER